MKKQKQKIKNTDENIPAVNFLGRNFAGGNSPGGREGGEFDCWNFLGWELS